MFLLETKNLGGIVELRDGMPHLRRRHDPDADTPCERIRPRALAAAAGLKGDIERRTGHRIWVQAVVVFWSEFPEGLVDDGTCVFAHGPRLRAFLEGRTNQFNDIQIVEITAAIAHIASQDPTESAGVKVRGPMGRAEAGFDPS